MTTFPDDSIYESHTISHTFDKCVKQRKGEHHVCVLSL